MPFDEPVEQQDEAAMLPLRFGYPLADDEDGDSRPSIGMRIMQMAPAQASAAETAPLRGIDEQLQQAAKVERQIQATPSIGQRIMQIGNQGVPAFDIQDGRPVWRQAPQTLTKPNIGQRILQGASSGATRPATFAAYQPGIWGVRPEPLSNLKPSETPRPEPIPNFNPSNSPRLETLPLLFPRTPTDQTYQHRDLPSGRPLETARSAPERQSNSAAGALASSYPGALFASTVKEGSTRENTPEYLRGPLDFNEFASFLNGRNLGNLTSENQGYLTSLGTQAAQAGPGSVPETLGRTVGAASGTAAGGGLGAAGQQARQSINQKPPVKGSVGRGGENDPARVKAIQHLLNEAIEVGHLPGSPLEENGKVTDEMLTLLERYQKANKAPKEVLLTDRSLTTRKLKENPLEDSRWDGYDGTIMLEVNSFNKSLKEKYPDFPGLDWRLVKAMLWQESGGPGRGKEWKTWPMQIGRRKADLAIQDVISGGYNTKLIALEGVRDEIAKSYRQHKMTPSLNIRGAVIYLCARAISGFEPERDAPKLQEQLGEGQSLSTFADRHGTTVENLKMLNPRIIGKERSLQPTTLLIYQKTKPVWSPWERAVHNYNSEITDPDYVKKVLRYYEAIKKRWSQESTARQR